MSHALIILLRKSCEPFTQHHSVGLDQNRHLGTSAAAQNAKFLPVVLAAHVIAGASPTDPLPIQLHANGLIYLLNSEDKCKN